jgi:hypothetical protein
VSGKCEQCGAIGGHFSACIGSPRSGDWAGKSSWRLAAERGHPSPTVTQEEWESPEGYHLRHHVTVWAESLRVGLLTPEHFAATMRGLLDELGL